MKSKCFSDLLWKPTFPCQSYTLREASQELYHLCGGPSKDNQQNHVDYMLAYFQEMIKEKI